MSRFTPWFRMDQKPVRDGEYEGRCKLTGARMPVFWRRLDDTPAPGWYFWKGVLGPFNCWESAEHRMKGWRGLREKPE